MLVLGAAAAPGECAGEHASLDFGVHKLEAKEEGGGEGEGREEAGGLQWRRGGGVNGRKRSGVGEGVEARLIEVEIGCSHGGQPNHHALICWRVAGQANAFVFKRRRGGRGGGRGGGGGLEGGAGQQRRPKKGGKCK
jgi:hypothetical protein